MARALAPSLSQSATSRAPRILERIGRCAVCGTAPTPINPTRTSFDWANGGPRIVGGENRPERLPGARPADRAPLAHSDAVAVAPAAERQRGDEAVRIVPG